jgi:hypothetical protein
MFIYQKQVVIPHKRHVLFCWANDDLYQEECIEAEQE